MADPAEQSSVVIAFRALVMLASLFALPLLAITGVPIPQEFRNLLPRIASRIDPRPPTSTNAAPPRDEAPLYRLRMNSSETTHCPAEGVISSHFSTDKTPMLPEHVQAPSAYHRTAESSLPGVQLVAASRESLIDRSADQTAGRFPTAMDADRIERLQQRIKETGATQFRLERWGPSGSLYRFQASVAVGGDPCCRRCFQAIDADAAATMEKVLRRLENQ